MSHAEVAQTFKKWDYVILWYFLFHKDKWFEGLKCCSQIWCVIHIFYLLDIFQDVTLISKPVLLSTRPSDQNQETIVIWYSFAIAVGHITLMELFYFTELVNLISCLQESLPVGKVLVDGETALVLGSSNLSTAHEGEASYDTHGILCLKTCAGIKSI